jgi:DNA primase large subunit
MDIVLDRKELIKYPFLKESQQLARQHVESLEAFLSSGPGGIALERAKDRVIAAFTHKREFPEGNTQNLKPELEIASYALARVLVSCSGNRSLVNQLARYEAERTSFYLETEDPEVQRFVAWSIGIDIKATSMPVTNYVELVPHMRDPRWRLVNRDLQRGMVHLGPGEIDELIRERIRVVLVDQMPLRVPAAICERLEPITEEISAAYQQQILEQFGEVQEEAFPPCISALIQAIATGTNISHMGRFAVTSFLHTVGMSGTGIVEMFAQAPDFDLEKTMYQVDHISGGGGTEYTPPSCPTMRTFGLCVNPNKDCERVNHPLRYYRLRKTRTRRPG